MSPRLHAVVGRRQRNDRYRGGHKADLARRSLVCPLLGRSGHAAITAGVSLGRE
jgi:hypothetical protein